MDPILCIISFLSGVLAFYLGARFGWAAHITFLEAKAEEAALTAKEAAHSSRPLSRRRKESRR